MSEHGCNRPHGDRRQALVMLLGGGLAGAALGTPRQASAGATQMAPLPADERFMRLAIAEAAKADFPFGAVIVRDGDVLATGRNLGKTTNDPTAHGEMVVIRHFVAARPADELKGTTLYTSGEPCPMCMSAILWCGIGRVVFAASIDELATKLGQIMLTSRQWRTPPPSPRSPLQAGCLPPRRWRCFRSERTRQPGQPPELGQCRLQLSSNLLQFALHSPFSQSTMHCCCSSGSAHCALQESAFVLQLVWQASA
jgi:guanine deaminase